MKKYTYGSADNAGENSFEKIYKVVRQIPKGRVATYGQIAALAGNRRWARVVGFALHVNPDPDGIPCFRVVNRNGATARYRPHLPSAGKTCRSNFWKRKGFPVRRGKWT